MIKNILINLGFVDVTESVPIKFRETLTEYFNSKFIYRRFTKTIDDVRFTILIGNHRKIVNVIIIGMLYDKIYKAEFETFIEYLESTLNKYLNVVKAILKEYNIDTSAGHPTYEGDDIVRYSFEKRRVKDKEP